MPKTSVKIRYILSKLNELYPSPPIPLDHKDPYTLLIAVLLSAQCTDARVNEVTPLLFKKANTPQKMVKLNVSEIQAIIRTCGLGPTKAKAIHRLSEILLQDYGGKVPESIEELEKLPGVGHKTASVVVSQAFNQPAFPVDTHIHRLAKRWKLSKATTVTQTEKDLKRQFPKDSWKDVHLQMIYYGRAYCPARGHTIEECPICNHLQEIRRKKK